MTLNLTQHVAPIQAAVAGNNVWPIDTELIYVLGTTKIMLTAQSPVMRTVLTDSFENLHASLLIHCAFPNASAIPTFIRDALVFAASSNRPRASNIHDRLLLDSVYLATLSHLVSCLIGDI